MATETDAARERVLAARAALGEELENLGASVREAVDVPAKIRRSPAKAAAIAGGAAFLVLGGPKRVFRAGKRAVTGEPGPLPESLLPEEIERTLRKLGDDGDKVRGALERDFAEYVKRANKDRKGLQSALLLSVARPLLAAGAKAAARSVVGGGDESLKARLAEIRERTKGQADGGEDDAERDIPVTERAKRNDDPTTAKA